MEHHKTKDILHVMKMLGHRNIKNTLIYTQLVSFENEDEFACRAAKTVEEAKGLIRWALTTSATSRASGSSEDASSLWTHP